MRSSWLYFATRSLRDGAPVLICPAFTATARSAIVVSSVSPERCEITVAYPAPRASSIDVERLAQRADLVHLHQDRVRDARVDPAAEEVDVRHEEVVADELHPVAQSLGEDAPVVPGVLVEPVLDRHERVTVGERAVEVDHPSRIEPPAFAGKLVDAVLEHLARRRVERDRDPLAVPRALRGLEDRRDRLLRRLEVGGEAALVADARREPALVQHGLQVVEDLRADPEGVAEAVGAGRYDHELLQVEPVLRVRAPVDDVHERHREDARMGPAEPAIQRLSGVCGSGFRRGERAAEDRVGAEPALRRRPVELDEDPVDLALIRCVDPGERPGNLAVNVGDCLQHALTQVELGILRPGARPPRARPSKLRTERPRGRRRRTSVGRRLRAPDSRASP